MSALIALASDHVGLELKQEIENYLTMIGESYRDYGTDTEVRCDYPVYANKAGVAVVKGECSRGILICGTGAGMSIAANKIKGIRCVCCSDSYTAAFSRRHNNTNMLALGSRVTGKGLALQIVEAWLKETYEGGRHDARLDEIRNLENGAGI